MPIYEYVCQACDRKTEVIQNFGERRLRICPRCGGKLKKAFSAPAIHFKGSGFYLTDSGRAKKEGKPDGSSKESKPAESKPAESKPAESKPSESKPSEPKKEKTEAKTESKKESRKKGD